MLCSGSNPTVAQNRPNAADVIPLAMESPTSPAMTENANTMRANISMGPIFKATAAMSGETVKRTMSLKASPVIDE